jgi:hypothetical protein
MRAIPIRRLLARLAVIAVAAAAPVGVAHAKVSLDDTALDAHRPVALGSLAPDTAAVALGRHLALALAEVAPIEATRLATTWSLSRDPLHRRAVAEALEWPFRLVGDSVILDHLSRDQDRAIRVASARAAWARRAGGGDDGVLERLAHDPDPDVREVARTAG